MRRKHITLRCDHLPYLRRRGIPANHPRGLTTRPSGRRYGARGGSLPACVQIAQRRREDQGPSLVSYYVVIAALVGLP